MAEAFAGLFGKTVTPIIGMTTVMLEGENTNVVRKHTVVDGLWETRHEIAPDVCLDKAPPVGSVENDKNSSVGGVQELSTERGQSPLVKLRRPN
jgi:hypothetical protein